MMTRQEAFNRSLAHLRAQGRRSIKSDGVSCRYRGPNGTKCAIGALMLDEEYDPNFEGLSVLELHIIEAIYGDSNDADFYFALQGQLHDNLHDEGYAESLEASAILFAEEHNLELA